MKKILVTVIIMIYITFYCTSISRATDSSIKLPLDPNSTGEQFNSLYDEGEATITSDGDSEITSEKGIINPTNSQNGLAITGVANIFTIVPVVINNILANIVMSSGESVNINGKPTKLFTIENLLLNNYPLFDIDFFDTSKTGLSAELSNDIKANVVIWYIALRNLAVIACAIIAIYVGIRMATSITRRRFCKVQKDVNGMVYWNCIISRNTLYCINNDKII